MYFGAIIIPSAGSNYIENKNKKIFASDFVFERNALFVKRYS